MHWWVVSLQLPTEPSRHRVAGWRELRRAAAVSLSNGTWALPDTQATPAVLDRLRQLARRETVTLLTATKVLEISGASVLAEMLAP